MTPQQITHRNNQVRINDRRRAKINELNSKHYKIKQDELDRNQNKRQNDQNPKRVFGNADR